MSDLISYLPVAAVIASVLMLGISLTFGYQTILVKRIVHEKVKERARRDIEIQNLLTRMRANGDLSDEDLAFAKSIIESVVAEQLSIREKKLVEIGLHQERKEYDKRYVRNLMVSA